MGDDSNAFALAILALHGDALAKYLQRKGVAAQDVEDVLQEVVLGACRLRHTWDPSRCALRTWLIAIAANQFTHYRERAHRRRERLWIGDRLFAVTDEQPDSEVRLSTQYREALLRRFLDQVPPEQSEVLIRYELREMTMPEVAAELGISESTAWGRHRAAWTALILIVERWRAQQRRRGLDDIPVVLLPFLVESRSDADAPSPSPASRSGRVPRPSGLRVVQAAAFALALGVAALRDASPRAIDLTVAGSARLVTTTSAVESTPAAEPIELQGSPGTVAPEPPPPPAPTHRERRPDSAEADVQRELALLAAAASEARSGTRHRAHWLLEQHAREFPHGQLVATRKRLLRQIGAN